MGVLCPVWLEYTGASEKAQKEQKQWYDKDTQTRVWEGRSYVGAATDAKQQAITD